MQLLNEEFEKVVEPDINHDAIANMPSKGFREIILDLQTVGDYDTLPTYRVANIMY